MKIQRLLLVVAGVCLFSLAACSISSGQEKMLAVIMELPAEDGFSIDPKTVIEHCSNALAKREKHKPEIVANLLTQRGHAYGRARDYLAAKKDFDELCKLQPNNAGAYCTRAETLLALNKPKEALNDYEEAIRIDPKSSRAYAGIAALEWDRGDDRKALEYIVKAMAFDQKVPAVYYAHSEIYLNIDSAKSLESINKVIEMNPSFGYTERPIFIRGFCQSRMNRPKEALVSFLFARRLNPKSLATTTEIAIAYSELGKYHLASHYAEECIKLDSSDPIGYSLCAQYYGKCGKLKEAIEAADKHLAINKKKKCPPCSIAKDCVAVGRYAMALEYFDKAILDQPDHFYAYVGKASLLATCDDPKYRDGAEALKIATKVFEGTPDRDYGKWRAAMALAEAYAETGDFEKAVKYAKSAVEYAGPDCGRTGELTQKLKLFEMRRPYRTK